MVIKKNYFYLPKEKKLDETFHWPNGCMKSIFLVFSIRKWSLEECFLAAERKKKNNFKFFFLPTVWPVHVWNLFYFYQIISHFKVCFFFFFLLHSCWAVSQRRERKKKNRRVDKKKWKTVHPIPHLLQAQQALALLKPR